MVQDIEWTCRRELDADVSTFRKFLDEWIATRTDKATDQYFDAPKRLTWPALPTPLDYSMPFEMGSTKEGGTIWQTGERTRLVALEKGQYCFRWERPPQSRLLKKTGAED